MAKAFKLQNGLLLLTTEAPGGVYNSTQLKKIAGLCDGETAVVKATEDQRLALFVAEAQVAKVTSELKAVGLGVRHYQDGLHQPVNCLGELCPEFLQDAMGASMDIAEELKAMKLVSPFKIGINGCARVCVATHTLDVSIIGDTNGYRISLGGKNSQIPEMASFMAEGVPADKLPKLIAKVIGIYKELAQPEESLQEVMERAGTKRFVEALDPYSQDAHQEDPFAGPDSGATGDLAMDEMKLEDLPAGDEFGDTSVETGPEIEGLGDEFKTDELEAGPNFDDVGPETELGAEDELLVPIEAATPPADDGLILEEVPVEAGAAEEMEIEEVVADELMLEEQVDVAALEANADAVGDELDFEAEELLSPAPKPLVAVPALANDDELGDEMAASEIDEDEADALEAKLNESIAEEESMPEVEDLNSADRLEAMKLVESGSDVSVDAVHETLATDGSFDDLEIGNEHEIEFEADEDDIAEDFGEPAAKAAASGSFELTGVDFAPGGRFVLSFSTGANVAVDPQSLQPGARRDLVMGGKRIGLTSGPKGLSVEVDGVTLFLPRRAA